MPRIRLLNAIAPIIKERENPLPAGHEHRLDPFTWRLSLWLEGRPRFCRVLLHPGYDEVI